MLFLINRECHFPRRMRPRCLSTTTSGRFLLPISPREIRNAHSRGSLGITHLLKCNLKMGWPSVGHFQTNFFPLSSTVPAGTKWTKFNVGQYGYYRVQYPLAEWQQFGELLQTDMVRWCDYVVCTGCRWSIVSRATFC